MFSEKFKIARVTLIFNSGEETMLNNIISDQYQSYRAFLNYLNVSCITGFIVSYKKTTYYMKNNLVSKKQFSFQASHSTEHAIFDLLNQIYDSFNKNEFTVGVFINFSKAFGAVNHDILIAKLVCHGIKNKNIK